ncbi:MAG: ABC transporter ATP-binding protein [Firmicutes bacterium]|nr:ABC transporter ATP-binding protein [Bacillota bacterium]
MVEGLTKSFGERVAYKDVSFEVGYGEVFGFLGPNGAGKTTTVRTLSTLIKPTSGQATIAGITLGSDSDLLIRERIAIMPESPGLYSRLTVSENLECFAGLYELKDVKNRIDKVLKSVNLADRKNDLCGSLSKGLRQRVALARALLSDPEILFLDEPTSGLDPVATRDVHDLLMALRERGVTIFLTTHRLEEAEKLCHRVAILNTTLKLIGSPAELREQLFSRNLEIKTGSQIIEPERIFTDISGIQSWEQSVSGSYIVNVSDPDVVAPWIVRALVGAGIDVLAIGETRHSLEDVYLELINEDVEAKQR